jgi:hypothetical protein
VAVAARKAIAEPNLPVADAAFLAEVLDGARRASEAAGWRGGA